MHKTSCEKDRAFLKARVFKNDLRYRIYSMCQAVEKGKPVSTKKNFETKQNEAKRSLRSSCSGVVKQNSAFHVFGCVSLGSHTFFRFRFASN
jgi:hypothetical protein